MKLERAYEVKTICPHVHPHWDEVVAVVLLRMFGEAIFPGIKNAPTVPRKLSGTEEENLAMGIMPIGQCFGIFDDKDSTGKRIEGTCCARKTAKYLGVNTNPIVFKLLQQTMRVDSSATASCTDISSLMKDAINSFPESKHLEIFRWAEKAVEAIIYYYGHQSGNNNARIDYVKPEAVLDLMIEYEAIVDVRIMNKLREKLRISEVNVDNCLEISFISRAMKVVGISDTEVFEWILTGLLKYVEQQELYFKALDTEIEENGKPFSIVLGSGLEVKGLLIRSKNPQVAKASRNAKFGYALTIVRQATGHTAIMPNTRFGSLNMEGVSALIRLNDTKAEKFAFASFSKYTELGIVPFVPNWYVMESGAILNSMKNGVEATKLTDKEIITLVKLGLSGEACELFNQFKNRLLSEMTTNDSDSTQLGQRVVGTLNELSDEKTQQRRDIDSGIINDLAELETAHQSAG